jgi:predicted short-subunit dehydrogenase-like oxidoreductase (DUF2520 family)
MNVNTAALARPGRLSVGVIGAGRVGSVLGAALRRAGHRITAVSAVSEASRARARTLLPDVPLREPPAVAAGSDLLLLAVPDDVLAGLVDGLIAVDAVRPGQLIVHPSGRHGVGVLTAATRIGALPLALHPAMTFAGTADDLRRLSGASFGVTAPEPLRPVAEALVLEMGGEPVWIPEDRRALYHAGLATGSNHLVTLVGQASDLLRAAGVENPAAVLAPLLTAALEGALRVGDAALTGPVARGDAGTVAAHLDQIAAESAASHAAYLAMARLTADRALAARVLDPAAAEALLDVLARPPQEAST